MSQEEKLVRRRKRKRHSLADSRYETNDPWEHANKMHGEEKRLLDAQQQVNELDIKPAHYCHEWDYLFINPGDPEMECCTCKIVQPPDMGITISKDPPNEQV